MSTIEGGQAVSASNADTRFDIDRQMGESINNVGGNQTFNIGSRGRSEVVGKALGVLGLVLSLGGLALLVSVAVTTTQSVLDAVKNGGAEAPYTEYLASTWPPAVALLVAGIVFKRLGRVMVR
jgi:hypothetical protein